MKKKPLNSEDDVYLIRADGTSCRFGDCKKKFAQSYGVVDRVSRAYSEEDEIIGLSPTGNPLTYRAVKQYRHVCSECGEKISRSVDKKMSIRSWSSVASGGRRDPGITNEEFDNREIEPISYGKEYRE